MTDLDKKRLRNMHPMYGRMSGEVVWELLKECQYTDEQCGETLDAILLEMHDVIRTMHSVESGDVQQLRLVADEDACKWCAALRGKIIVGSHPDWMKCLPPYGLGCKIRCEGVVDSAVSAGGNVLLSAEDVPACGLLCPLISGE